MLGGMGLPARDCDLVQLVEAALADAARRAGEWLVCRPGCTQCCMGAFAINELDALRLCAGMRALRESSPALAETVERRAREWIGEFGAEFPGDLATGILDETEEAQERFEEFANEAPCPALDPLTGLCDLYAWRPMTCRVFGPPVRVDTHMGDGQALGHCELCFGGATEQDVARCEMTVPHPAEAELMQEIGVAGETVVAFALQRSGDLEASR